MILSALGIPKVAKASHGESSDQTTFTNRTFVATVMVHIVNTINETNFNLKMANQRTIATLPYQKDV